MGAKEEPTNLTYPIVELVEIQGAFPDTIAAARIYINFFRKDKYSADDARSFKRYAEALHTGHQEWNDKT